MLLRKHENFDLAVQSFSQKGKGARLAFISVLGNIINNK